MVEPKKTPKNGAFELVAKVLLAIVSFCILGFLGWQSASVLDHRDRLHSVERDLATTMGKLTAMDDVPAWLEDMVKSNREMINMNRESSIRVEKAIYGLEIKMQGVQETLEKIEKKIPPMIQNKHSL